MRTKKLIFFIFVPIIIAFFLTGCMESYTSFEIHEDGTADVIFALVADEIMAGEESDMIAFGLLNNILELQTNYEYSREVDTIDYSDYVYQIFASKTPVDITSHRFITFTKKDDGTYEFLLEFPALIDSIEEDSDSLVFTLDVSLPREIDMANSTDVEGNRVIWYVYKKDLVKGVTLKAYTK